jgi:hypothetical protein
MRRSGKNMTDIMRRGSALTITSERANKHKSDMIFVCYKVGTTCDNVFVFNSVLFTDLSLYTLLLVPCKKLHEINHVIKVGFQVAVFSYATLETARRI